jgi:hypothetical protein
MSSRTRTTPTRSSSGTRPSSTASPACRAARASLGTFDRPTAVDDERLDYFASGHPLVEGLLAHLEESSLGRVTVLRVTIGDARGIGLLALYKGGPAFEAVAVDPAGRLRPEWARALRRRPLRTRRVALGTAPRPGWEATIRDLAATLDPSRPPVALAALVLGP